MIINAKLHAAENLCHIDPLRTHAEVTDEEIRINERTHDAHGHTADADIALVPHLTDCDRAARETKDLLLHVRRDFILVHVLNIVPVNRINRPSDLIVGGNRRCEIDRARALRTVKTPDCLDGERIDVNGLHRIAPARRDRERRDYIFRRELRLCPCRLLASRDARVRRHALHRCPVRIAYILRNQLYCRFRHCRGLALEFVADPKASCINDRPYADLWILFHIRTPFLFRSWSFH